MPCTALTAAAEQQAQGLADASVHSSSRLLLPAPLDETPSCVLASATAAAAAAAAVAFADAQTAGKTKQQGSDEDLLLVVLPEVIDQPLKAAKLPTRGCLVQNFALSLVVKGVYLVVAPRQLLGVHLTWSAGCHMAWYELEQTPDRCLDGPAATLAVLRF